MIYRLATPTDRPALTELLTQAKLLTDDLPENLGTFILAFDNDTLAGTAGVDIIELTGLLRSVAVAPAYQHQHIGRQLIAAAEKLASDKGIMNLYLITTTADRYFDRLGFERVDRNNVPEAIATTRQFSELCPASSVVMSKSVTPKLQLR
ncbi:arsenic resistance N-acetyltransferase ArsN2 [Fibrella forsythiae]|uniref:GNAT family N-acetyltransferase n=1 Tax=Fibrella forsythiae TaxID=2817061 RepID=A0ABS3JLS9_9BACT|nr:arsenic resistance N-acetyltransferase ArsN2 [Fibrella forsythiae]MBO0949862.1 GNAT family N-acetyltransferase [Fibrella forsythiae]